MYVCSDLNKNNNCNSKKLGNSEYIPEQYIGLKNKKFYGWEIAPWEIFIFKDKLLGEGSFAKVYLAKWRETLVVAKVINEDICDTYQKEFILRETDIMSKLHVDEIKGNTGTTVTLTSGQTLAASGTTISGNPSLSGGLKTGTIQSTGGTTAMTIDSTGRILTPARPAFRAKFNASGTLTDSARCNIQFQGDLA